MTIQDKQAAHDAFGQLVGPERGFRLLRCWTEAGYVTSGDKFTLPPPKRTTTDVFRKKAKDAGFNEEEIQAFLDLP